MAFLPAFSKKCLRSSPPQATTTLCKSTSLSKFVVRGMCCHVRKCVQRMRDLIAALFLILSCLSTFWSCCMIETSRSAPSAAKAAWLAWEWRRLFIHYFEVKNDVPENLCDPLYTLPYVKMMYCFELLFLDQLLTRIASTKAVWPIGAKLLQITLSAPVL